VLLVVERAWGGSRRSKSHLRPNPVSKSQVSSRTRRRFGAASPSLDAQAPSKKALYRHRPGRPAVVPLIDTDQGDLLLFLFLLSGVAGGFVAGYAFRALFPPKVRAGTPDASEVP
jgi:hypothetical protein